MPGVSYLFCRNASRHSLLDDPGALIQRLAHVLRLQTAANAPIRSCYLRYCRGCAILRAPWDLTTLAPK